MKKLSNILFAIILIMGLGNLDAQTKNNPWAFSIGFNAVDFYPVGVGAPQGALMDNFFNTHKHWNIIPAPSKIKISHYIGAGLSGQINGSLNRITKLGDQRVGEDMFYNLSGGVDYSLGYLLDGENLTAIDPYLGIGLGSTWIENKGELTGDIEFGFNFWLNKDKTFGLTLASTYRGALNHNHTNLNHFQHFAGVKFMFGGKDTDGDGIYDKEDDCPNTPGLPEFNGCPDTDGDGIPDNEDDCPKDPGLPEFNGCPDTDGDGVPDNKDDCPLVPGLKEHNGCPEEESDITEVAKLYTTPALFQFYPKKFPSKVN